MHTERVQFRSPGRNVQAKASRTTANGTWARSSSFSTPGRTCPPSSRSKPAAALLELDYAAARFGSVDEIYKSEASRDILAEPTLLFADADKPDASGTFSTG